MTVVGYDDEEKHFVIRNSWGPRWGDSGYCYYKYDDWESHWECWTTVDIDTVLNDDSISSSSEDEAPDLNSPKDKKEDKKEEKKEDKKEDKKKDKEDKKEDKKETCLTRLLKMFR